MKIDFSRGRDSLLLGTLLIGRLNIPGDNFILVNVESMKIPWDSARCYGRRNRLPVCAP